MIVGVKFFQIQPGWYYTVCRQIIISIHPVLLLNFLSGAGYYKVCVFQNIFFNMNPMVNFIFFDNIRLLQAVIEQFFPFNPAQRMSCKDYGKAEYFCKLYGNISGICIMTVDDVGYCIFTFDELDGFINVFIQVWP